MSAAVKKEIEESTRVLLRERLSRMDAKQLIDEPDRGMVRASEVLFQ